MIKIKLNDTGPIKSAEFDIGGLTVIAGLNKTGKTFISKTIFSLIKTVKDSEQFLESSQEEQLEFLFRKTDLIIRSITRPKRLILDKDQEKLLIKEASKDYDFLRDFKDKLSIIDRQNDDIISTKLNSLKELCYSLTIEPKLEDEYKSKFTELLEEIETFERDLEKPEANIAHKKCFDNFLNTTFKKNFNNLFSQSAATVKVSDENNNELISVQVQNNKVADFVNASTLPLKEITYLFSPVILQFFKFISLTTSRRYLGLTSFGNSYRQEYEISKSLGAIIADLFSKLILSSDSFYPLEGRVSNFLMEKIKELTGGYLEYDDKERDFVFRFEKKGKKVSLPVSNTAEGIKAFGILQLLLGV